MKQEETLWAFCVINLPSNLELVTYHTMVDLDLRASPYVCEMVPAHFK